MPTSGSQDKLIATSNDDVDDDYDDDDLLLSNVSSPATSSRQGIFSVLELSIKCVYIKVVEESTLQFSFAMPDINENSALEWEGISK